VSRWLVASGDFTTLGGMDRANHAQARHLARRGDEVHLVAHRVADDLAALPNVHVHPVARPLGAHLAGAPLLAEAAKRQRGTLGPSAHVLVNGGNASGPATWVHYLHAAYEPRTRASLRSRVSSSLGRRYYLARERAVLSRASLVICNSRRTADDIHRCYRVAESRQRVVYYGVDGTLFGARTADQREAARAALGLSPDRRAALFIGALGDRRKGFDALFDAWRLVAAEPSWDVDLLVAGTGAERAAWERRAAQAFPRERVRFLGFRGDVADVIAAADVLVHPARYEAYGLGVHEAICRGVPAIVTRTAGIAERYPDALRDLLIEGEVEATPVAEALWRWRSAADAWAARNEAFAASLRSRSWDAMAAEIAALVEGAAA
jgi:glycosyltransferase involved in cell wall biosynthesis